MLRNTSDYYGWPVIIMHWLSALSIYALFMLGLWMRGLDYYHGWYVTAPHLHKSFGLILMLVTFVRILWVFINPKPVPQTISNREKMAAITVHYFLYLLLLIAMLSGYLISTAGDRSVDLFNWLALPPLPWSMPEQEQVSGAIHTISSYLLVIVSGLHVLAAIKHHMIDHDETLIRILRPGYSSRDIGE